jgi:hypothetical protein
MRWIVRSRRIWLYRDKGVLTEALPRGEGMSGEEIGSGHFATAFALDAFESECTGSAGDDDASRGGGEDFAG